MSLKRIWVMFKARNYEFFRDKAAFGWNFLFPFLIIAGFAIIFGGRDFSGFKVGVFPSTTKQIDFTSTNLPEKFITTTHLEFIGFPDQATGLKKLKHHQIDFLIRIDTPTPLYWQLDSSPKGYLVERLFQSAFVPENNPYGTKEIVEGREIRYLDWLFPGILGMNMMFSALWGVGYVVVRYRKNGVLKRLKATPLTAFEYMTAQALSRFFLQIFTLIVVWIGADLLFSIHVEGSLVALSVVFALGGLSLTSVGLLLAARGTSEEFTSGALNFIAWPMMFLSEVWFSLEGAPQWVKGFAEVLPLTHLLRAARHIMNDGATLAQVSGDCLALIITTLICLVLGATLFSWND
ncbi:MAG: ABC transporter permease [Proteobacteria bacterium]|nr:ABC transporter permease [Pseudomonadota bacterium]MBU1687188.1 ABC transporter permease [Pseudomonadota bacterium]